MSTSDTQMVLTPGSPVMYLGNVGLVIAIHHNPLRYDILVSGHVTGDVLPENLAT